MYKIEKYCVYEDGRIVNSKTQKVLKLDKNLSGHFRVTLCVNGVTNRSYVHRIIATAFIPNPEGKPFVNHLDGDKSNNAVSNLEWVTCKENTEHAFRTGLRGVGMNHYSATVTDEVVHKVCQLISEGWVRGSVLQELGIKQTLFDDIRRRKSWKHISKDYVWNVQRLSKA